MKGRNGSKNSLVITIPEKDNIIESGIIVPIAPKGASWFQNVLGNLAKKQGVYVIHHRRSIKYVGKTNGIKMSFGIRLRRHFQESAAGSKHTYPKLSKLNPNSTIKVTLIELDVIKKHITHDVTKVIERDLIPLYEAALITAYKPVFQR